LLLAIHRNFDCLVHLQNEFLLLFGTSPPLFRKALVKRIFEHGHAASKRVSLDTAHATTHVYQAGVQLAECLAEVHCVGKGSETGRPLGIGSEWEIWLVTKCLDVNEGKDTHFKSLKDSTPANVDISGSHIGCVFDNSDHA
jgi:hypothetical protein